jgi:putative oxidoreductase
LHTLPIDQHDRRFDDAAFFLIRLAVGSVFLLEGVLKWIQPQMGIGRFEEIGIPFPALSVLLIGVLEIICASMLLANVHIKKAAVLLIGIMIGALVTTKLPLLGQVGLIQMLREARLDFVLLLCNLYLFLQHERDNRLQTD